MHNSRELNSYLERIHTVADSIKWSLGLYEYVSVLSYLAKFKSVEPNVSSHKPPSLHRGIINPAVDNDNDDHIEIIIQDTSTDTPEKESESSKCK